MGDSLGASIRPDSIRGYWVSQEAPFSIDNRLGSVACTISESKMKELRPPIASAALVIE